MRDAQGLRTLALGSKVLEEEEWAAWDARYQEAAADLDDRDARLAALYTEVELNLELVGVTAIEDKLQVGVPEAIHTLLQAGIKVSPRPRCGLQGTCVDACGWHRLHNAAELQLHC